MKRSTQNRATPKPSPERRLPVLLRHAWYALNQTFRRRIAHAGLTPGQFTALRTLSEAGDTGLTQRALTRLMASDPNTVTVLMVRLEKRGWVRRVAHEEDGRANRVTLAPAGLRKFQRVRHVAEQLRQQALTAIPSSRRETFLDDLARLAETCRDLLKEQSR